MIVLDTTVLVYAVGSEHPLRDPCRDIVAAVARGALRATTTVEVLQEVAHVRARRRPRADAVALVRDYVDLLGPLLPVGETALQHGLRIFEGHERVGAFDAVLAAAVLESGAEALVSADTAFSDIEGLPHRFPDAIELR